MRGASRYDIFILYIRKHNIPESYIILAEAGGTRVNIIVSRVLISRIAYNTTNAVLCNVYTHVQARVGI
jgi:hypothetical protein